MPWQMVARVGWSHLDANGHMRNTAYLDLAADARMAHFASVGFPLARFAALQIGPVVQRDETDYIRELRLHDEYRITLTLAGIAEDGARFRLRNEFQTPTGLVVARITSHGGWLDLVRRRLTPPPPDLAPVLRSLSRSEDFTPLPSLPPH